MIRVFRVKVRAQEPPPPPRAPTSTPPEVSRRTHSMGLRKEPAAWTVSSVLALGDSDGRFRVTFSVLAPQWWNELPTDVRTAESLPIFRRRLKTHLFRKHYPDPSS